MGAGPRSVQCLGDSLPAGWSTLGFDVDDADAVVQWAEVDAWLLGLLQ
jgi:hypothetical protein